MSPCVTRLMLAMSAASRALMIGRGEKVTVELCAVDEFFDCGGQVGRQTQMT